MGKRVLFDDEARQALWRGLDQLASAVRITLGPRGRSVVFDRLRGVPAITRDGIAVAQEIELADAFEDVGLRMLREAAFATGQGAGDGTSTATVLAHRMIGEGLRAVASGHHPLALKRGIDRAVAAVCARLAEQARPVGGGHDLERVATIAAGDRALGEMVAHALERAGRDGVVTVEDGHGLDITLDAVEGARFDGGIVSPYFITDAEQMEAVLEHPLVVLVDGPLLADGEVIPVLEHAARLGRPLLWLCEGVGAEALPVLVVNRLRGRVQSAAVAIPGTPAERRELLDDLALLTGGAVVGADLGRTLERFEPAWFGRARHVVATTEQTTLRQGSGRREPIAAAIAGLRHSIGREENEGGRAVLRRRLGRLAGGIAVLRVGGANEFERQARRAQLEDALGATRAAIEEGVVPGGGLARRRAASAAAALELPAGEAAGRDAVLAALAEPARQIAINAGEEGDAIVARIVDAGAGQGFNARSCRMSDLEADGVLDAAKVVRSALQNAASVAGLVLSTDVLVVDAPAAEPGEGEAAA
jgi:chaperonin GroEL